MYGFVWWVVIIFFNNEYVFFSENVGVRYKGILRFFIDVYRKG